MIIKLKPMIFISFLVLYVGYFYGLAENNEFKDVIVKHSHLQLRGNKCPSCFSGLGARVRGFFGGLRSRVRRGRRQRNDSERGYQSYGNRMSIRPLGSSRPGNGANEDEPSGNSSEDPSLVIGNPYAEDEIHNQEQENNQTGQSNEQNSESSGDNETGSKDQNPGATPVAEPNTQSSNSGAGRPVPRPRTKFPFGNGPKPVPKPRTRLSSNGGGGHESDSARNEDSDDNSAVFV
ncbi:uncharacterized protein ELE39_000306 [Cryptosporidium sp. chipmunk genotype I]|uniref:uncharacterized protein n=1 Tax=Cryptosporidium sp. chipmunk genotype I TaxID=1280935 RepID=UPI00351A8B66|nr:hypothetical protein ELE39_000306 [Cryptosporidium sp. chipmunk genotype I]